MIPFPRDRGTLSVGDAVVIDVEEKRCPGCGGPMHATGEDVDEVLPARQGCASTRLCCAIAASCGWLTAPQCQSPP